MPNARNHDHLTDHNWMLEIEGVTQGAFAEVSGLDSDTEAVAYQDGDDLILRDAASGAPTGKELRVVTLSRGMINSDELWMWRKQEQAGRPEPRSGTLVRRDSTDRAVRYRFKGIRPLALEGRGQEIGVLKIAVERVERA